jgi:hypothetical protein
VKLEAEVIQVSKEILVFKAKLELEGSRVI